jgi:hypothetical protein
MSDDVGGNGGERMRSLSFAIITAGPKPAKVSVSIPIILPRSKVSNKQKPPRLALGYAATGRREGPTGPASAPSVLDSAERTCMSQFGAREFSSVPLSQHHDNTL